MKSANSRWYVLLVLTIVYVLNVADRFVISTLIEPIKAELGLSDLGVGFLTGIALAIFYLTMGLPIAVIADRANRRNIVTAAVAVWSLMTALCGLSQTFWQFLLARTGVGIGEAGGTPPSHSIISDAFAWKERAAALSIFALGQPLGSMLGSLGGYISDASGWRVAFFTLGMPGLLMALVVRFTISEPRRGGLDRNINAGQARFADTVKFMLGQRSLRHCLAGIFLFSFWGYGFLLWAPALLKRSYGLSVGAAGGVLAPIHGLGGTLMLLLTSWLMARIGQRDVRQFPWFIATVIAFATIPSIIACTTNSLDTVRMMLWLFIPFVYAAVGPFFALIQNLTPPAMRAQACAVALLIANLGNLVAAPLIVGAASDWLAARHGANSLRVALVPVGLVGFWAAAHFFAMGRSIEEDMIRSGTLEGPMARI
jgi:MFS family permease